LIKFALCSFVFLATFVKDTIKGAFSDTKEHQNTEKSNEPTFARFDFGIVTAVKGNKFDCPSKLFDEKII